MITLESQLIKFLRTDHTWHHKGRLTGDITWTHAKKKTRYMPETVGRGLRLLEESSVIAVKREGVSVLYKYLPAVGYYRSEYIPTTRRRHGQEHILFTRNLPAQVSLL